MGISAKKLPNPVDAYVGSRIRMRRRTLGMSQLKLATALELTFQQVQKYEKGTNRVGASRIQLISDLLGMPVSFFFEGAPSTAVAPSADNPQHDFDYVTAFISSSEGLAIARAFCKIKDVRIKRRLIDLIEVLSA